MALFRKPKAGGLMDEIRCDESSYLIWKWHPTGSVVGNNNRENAIRLGSSLRVKDGEVAVFVYKEAEDYMQDFIVGPYDQFLVTENLPVLASIVGLAYEGGSPFQAEVYFINLAKIIQVRFGVPFFDVYDPRFSDFGVPIAVRGTVSFSITDYKEFIALHRLSNFSLDDFQKQIRDAVNRYVRNTVANAPATYNIPVIQIETKTAVINEAIELDIYKRLKENFGVTVSGVDIGAIEIDKASEGYRYLSSVTRDVAVAKVTAETEDYIEKMRIQREEGQYGMHMQTQSANIAAFKVEKQAEVGIAGAEALGQMGNSGAGSIDLGNAGAGFNPVAMMTGMAIGGALGQNIASTINNPSNVGQQSSPGVVPPPLPLSQFYVAINGQSTGPYDMNTVRGMVTNGTITGETLVWKQGMSNWAMANSVEDIKSMFITPPPIPPVPPLA